MALLSAEGWGLLLGFHATGWLAQRLVEAGRRAGRAASGAARACWHAAQTKAGASVWPALQEVARSVGGWGRAGGGMVSCSALDGSRTGGCVQMARLLARVS